MDLGDGFGEVGRWWFCSGQDLTADLDGDGPVTSGGAHECLYAPTGLMFDTVRDGHRGEDDRQVILVFKFRPNSRQNPRQPSRQYANTPKVSQVRFEARGEATPVCPECAKTRNNES